MDEDQRIWELNESDNTFTKQYFAAEEVNVTIYIVAGTFSIFALISGLVMLRKRKNESKEAKKLPSLDNLPRSGPPKSSANTTKPQANRPKRGPPPKRKSRKSLLKAISQTSPLLWLSYLLMIYREEIKPLKKEYLHTSPYRQVEIMNTLLRARSILVMVLEDGN